MPIVVTEQFTQNLYADPSGTRKTNPTIFDELRWAIEFAQKPLEQVLQLISEFHGPWTGMNSQLLQFINSIAGIASSAINRQYITAAQNALKLFNSISNTSTVGRVNNIVAGNMSIPLLRQFVNKCQAIHPAVNNYIQLNIGKYPHFQQISESVCQHGQIVLHKTETDPIKRLNTDGATSMIAPNRLRRQTESKLFDTIKPMVNDIECFVNIGFLRNLPMDNNIGLLIENYSTQNPLAHGHNFCMDVFNADRGKAAMSQCVLKATERFGPSLQLHDVFFPVQNEVINTPQFFNLETETGNYIADKFNRPICRTPAIPIATDENKSAIV